MLVPGIFTWLRFSIFLLSTRLRLIKYCSACFLSASGMFWIFSSESFITGLEGFSEMGLIIDEVWGVFLENLLVVADFADFFGDSPISSIDDIAVVVTGGTFRELVIHVHIPL